MNKQKQVPAHVAIIMDGNRRWAVQRGLPKLAGHQKGYERAIEIAEHAFETGVRYLTIFAFSTENWKRPKAEVSYLMRLMKKVLNEQTERLHAKNIRLRFIGGMEKMGKTLADAMDASQKRTARNSAGTLVIAVNYGGRSEITDAVRGIMREKYKSNQVTDELIRAHMQSADIPDPDLIIRTSGEMRLSGFLLWQSAYSELFFSPKLWPAFTKAVFNAALDAYARRKRRFGA